MKPRYIVAHWLLTLLFAPMISQALEYAWRTPPHQVVSLLEIYPLTFLFSIFFSMPTLIVYLATFYLLTKLNIHLGFLKTILIAVAVVGIYITQSIIDGTMSPDIIISYSASAIISGILLPLGKTIIEAQKHIPI